MLCMLSPCLGNEIFTFKVDAHQCGHHAMSWGEWVTASSLTTSRPALEANPMYQHAVNATLDHYNSHVILPFSSVIKHEPTTLDADCDAGIL